MPDPNPLTRVLLTAIMRPDELEPMCKDAVREVVGLAVEAAGRGMRQGAESENTDAPDPNPDSE